MPTDALTSNESPLTGPPFVQVEGSRHCSSAWGENCCDLASWHEGLHWDETNGNRWVAERVNMARGWKV